MSENGQKLPLGGSKRRGVLAILLLHANEIVSVERLADELWSDEQPQNAAGAIHNHVSRLRKLLGADILPTHPGGYSLEVDPSRIDLHRFEQLISTAPAARPSTGLPSVGKTASRP